MLNYHIRSLIEFLKTPALKPWMHELIEIFMFDLFLITNQPMQDIHKFRLFKFKQLIIQNILNMAIFLQ